MHVSKQGKKLKLKMHLQSYDSQLKIFQITPIKLFVVCKKNLGNIGLLINKESINYGVSTYFKIKLCTLDNGIKII